MDGDDYWVTTLNSKLNLIEMFYLKNWTPEGICELLYLRPLRRPNLQTRAEKGTLVRPVPFTITIPADEFLFSPVPFFATFIDEFDFVSVTDRAGHIDSLSSLSQS